MFWREVLDAGRGHGGAGRLRAAVDRWWRPRSGPYGAMRADGSEYSRRLRPRRGGPDGLPPSAPGGAGRRAAPTCWPARRCPAWPRHAPSRGLLEEAPDRRGWISFSCRDDRHTSQGEDFGDCVAALGAVSPRRGRRRQLHRAAAPRLAGRPWRASAPSGRSSSIRTPARSGTPPEQALAGARRPPAPRLRRTGDAAGPPRARRSSAAAAARRRRTSAATAPPLGRRLRLATPAPPAEVSAGAAGPRRRGSRAGPPPTRGGNCHGSDGQSRDSSLSTSSKLRPGVALVRARPHGHRQGP